MGNGFENRDIRISTTSAVSTFNVSGIQLFRTPVSIRFSGENNHSRTLLDGQPNIHLIGDILAASPVSRFARDIGDFMFVAPRFGSVHPTLRLILSPGADGALANCADGRAIYIDGVDDINMNGDSKWLVNAVVSFIPHDVDPYATAGAPSSHAQSWVHMHMYHISPSSLTDDLDAQVLPFDWHNLFTSAGAVFEGFDPQSRRGIFTNCAESMERFPKLKYSLFTYTDEARTQLEKSLDLILMPTDYVTLIDDDRCMLNFRSGETRHRRVAENNVFGLNIFKNTNIHFDAVNGRIGFCDPIE